jgi:hypothetical protein
MNNYQQQQQVNMLQANALIRAMQQPQMSAV